MPQENRPVPPDAAHLLGPATTATLVWANEIGGLTYQLADNARTRYLKWFPAGCGIDPSDEISRLRRAGRFISVPSVVDHGGSAAGDWILTDALPGHNAVAERWKSDPEPAVRAIGRGLRLMHDELPVRDCPFAWSTPGRIAAFTASVSAGLADVRQWHPEHRALGIDGALERIAEPPPPDKFVVCHGDACAPNTLLDDHGKFAGHVDLGSLGVADRWADLAVATWSIEWNFGSDWESTLLQAYGIDPDPERTSFYRLLWDLAD